MKPCLKRFAGNRSSDKSSVPRVTQAASGELLANSWDMKRRKRVKFGERDAVPAISCHQDVSPPSTGDDPKTSEYKYFKKLLEEAGRGLHSHKPVGQGNILFTGHRGDLRAEQTYNNEADGSVPQVGKVTPMNQFPSLTTIGAPNDQEPQCNRGGTFYEKRQNLIKSAASALSLEPNDLLSKGCDLIPVLLHRLGIKRKADNCDEPQKTSIKNSNVRTQLLACPNIQNYLEETNETGRARRASTVVRDITENNFAGGWWTGADELCSSTKHVEAQFFPIRSMTMSDLAKSSSLPYFLLDAPCLPAENKSNLDFNPSAQVAISRWKQPMLDNKILTYGWVDHELSPFWGPYKEQPSPHGSFHLLEFDVLHSPNKAKRFSRQYSSPPLLEWNEEINNEEEPFVVSDSTEMTGLYQLPLALYHVSQSQGLIGDSGVVDSYTGSNFFHSFDDIRTLRDMTYPSLDHALLPPRAEFAVGSEWENLSTDYCREFLLSYNTDHQFGCISSNALQRCFLEPSKTERRNQIGSMICDLYDLSSFGFGISSERKKMAFLPATDE